MHLLAGAKYGVHRTGLDTDCATDTKIFIDDRDRQRLFFAIVWIKRFDIAAEQVGQSLNRRFATGRAAVDIRLTRCYRFSVWPAAWKVALSTLCLWQQVVDLLDYRVPRNLEPVRGKPKRQAQSEREQSDCNDSDQD